MYFSIMLTSSWISLPLYIIIYVTLSSLFYDFLLQVETMLTMIPNYCAWFCSTSSSVPTIFFWLGRSFLKILIMRNESWLVMNQLLEIFKLPTIIVLSEWQILGWGSLFGFFFLLQIFYLFIVNKSKSS